MNAENRGVSNLLPRMSVARPPSFTLVMIKCRLVKPPPSFPVVPNDWLLKSGQWSVICSTVSTGQWIFPDTQSGFWSRASERVGVRTQRIAPGSVPLRGSRVEGLLPLHVEETGSRRCAAPSS